MTSITASDKLSVLRSNILNRVHVSIFDRIIEYFVECCVTRHVPPPDKIKKGKVTKRADIANVKAMSIGFVIEYGAQFVLQEP